MRIQFAQNARKHKIGKAHALYVMEHYASVREYGVDSKENRLKWRGFDDRNLELEIEVIELTQDHWLVVHVMPARFRRRS